MQILLEFLFSCKDASRIKFMKMSKLKFTDSMAHQFPKVLSMKQTQNVTGTIAISLKNRKPWHPELLMGMSPDVRPFIILSYTSNSFIKPSNTNSNDIDWETETKIRPSQDWGNDWLLGIYSIQTHCPWLYNQTLSQRHIGWVICVGIETD